MNATAPPSPLNWSARRLIGRTLIIIGAAAATWGLARYQRAAHLLGVAPAAAPAVRAQPVANVGPALPDAVAADLAAAIEARVAGLEARLSRAENAARRAEGSAGRTDALVVAFAARRAIDRGVPLGYLETLLVDRFGARHPSAVATIVTVSRTPVRL